MGRWNGAFGNFTRFVAKLAGLPALANGDIVYLSTVGGTIKMYHNGVMNNTATDTTYTAGSPGIGTDLDNNGASPNSNFGFSSFSATDGVSGGNIYSSRKSRQRF